MNPQIIQALYAWQDLVGAFLGSSIAVIFSGIGFLLARRIDAKGRSKETLRQIEVATTYALNSTFTKQQKLKKFIESAEQLILDINAITDPLQYAMMTINLPPLGEIYVDSEIPHFRVRSYYLHNKILWIHAGTIDVNGVLADLKEGWQYVIKTNETLIIDLLKDRPNPPYQRATYVENIRIFIDEVERFRTVELEKGIETLLQAKVYNNFLRQPFFIGYFIYLWYEGFNFKDYRSLDSIDRIDANIQGVVDKARTEMNERALKLGL